MKRKYLNRTRRLTSKGRSRRNIVTRHRSKLRLRIKKPMMLTNTCRIHRERRRQMVVATVHLRIFYLWGSHSMTWDYFVAWCNSSRRLYKANWYFQPLPWLPRNNWCPHGNIEHRGGSPECYDHSSNVLGMILPLTMLDERLERNIWDRGALLLSPQ